MSNHDYYIHAPPRSTLGFKGGPATRGLSYLTVSVPRRTSETTLEVTPNIFTGARQAPHMVSFLCHLQPLTTLVWLPGADSVLRTLAAGGASCSYRAEEAHTNLRNMNTGKLPASLDNQTSKVLGGPVRTMASPGQRINSEWKPHSHKQAGRPLYSWVC